ncbi:glutamate--cysteine ligase catalytic subunit [Lingula anatina]|uniref:Glutamate--cysteine ligase n=1 Tax=Lingula anatina TaxID=7574 RepID=A0A1S3K6S3_LINAN|nr:glutamate--cysteine ligase catalytic subunit [Lingula anatina]|eukprot:XP_013418129.1 glutamate--cysteine ligase catalytic subunit [Lingula anatina]
MDGLAQNGERWLTAEEISDIWPRIRLHAAQEFVEKYQAYKNEAKKGLLWGDETEYILLHFDHEKKTVKVAIKAVELVATLKKSEEKSQWQDAWQREYSSYMVESVPFKPYAGDIESIKSVERSMAQRRQLIQQAFNSENSSVISIGTFPRTGCRGFTWPLHAPTPTSGITQSLFFPDAAITGGRYNAMAFNNRLNRRGRHTDHIPIFKDVHTMDPFEENLSKFGDKGKAQEEAQKDTIYIDNGISFFGASCSLQLTLQARDLDEARAVHDQLTALCPVLMALSAATPIHRGYLSDVDCRWPIFVQYTDEKTQEHLWQNRRTGTNRTTKSRIDSVSCYAQPCNSCYNDGPMFMDDEIFGTLLKHGVDDAMSRYVTNLFSRDPLGLSDRHVQQCGDKRFDSLSLYTIVQANNYPSVRLKIPSTSAGWCLEFRPLDVQLTDFENAAFAVFVVFLTRALLKYNINLAIPISKVDENMGRASKRDAVRSSKFYFRDDIFTNKEPLKIPNGIHQTNGYELNHNMFSLMTADEIFNGKSKVFPGLIQLVNRYLDDHDKIHIETRATAARYLAFIGKRASGETPTTARWIRDFVTSHPDYKKDSVVTERINYDLMCKCQEISNTNMEHMF